jgi:hypothetical protein
MSKVEQYLKTICTAPDAKSARQASSDCATASLAGIDRDFSEITAASHATEIGSAGIPAN